MIRLALAMVSIWCATAQASDPLNLLDFAPSGTAVDRTGKADASQALANVITAANAKTVNGEPACVYIPPGVYRIVTPPPAFRLAGCIKGDGPTQSMLAVDPQFEGDLFAWSEAWLPTIPGPTVVGLLIRGSEAATKLQNAFVFYDRNDEVFIENVDVINLHGRALYAGVCKNEPVAYMRESRLRSLRFFGDGAPGTPVVEFNSQGSGAVDGTNEIKMSQVDIYGSKGPSFVIRNNGSGSVGGITVDALRIEGKEHGETQADLLTIGDTRMKGQIHDVTFTSLELIDPYRGYAALRVTAPPGVSPPYYITVSGVIGGGLAFGQGLRIDAGRTSVFRMTGIHTTDTNVVIGPHVAQIFLDGAGQEAGWSYQIDPTSRNAISIPARATFAPSPQ
jgi:hypothetical protein